MNYLVSMFVGTVEERHVVSAPSFPEAIIAAQAETCLSTLEDVIRIEVTLRHEKQKDPVQQAKDIAEVFVGRAKNAFEEVKKQWMEIMDHKS